MASLVTRIVATSAAALDAALLAAKKPVFVLFTGEVCDDGGDIRIPSSQHLLTLSRERLAGALIAMMHTLLLKRHLQEGKHRVLLLR